MAAQKTIVLDAHRVSIANRAPLVVFAGPCVIESEAMTMMIAGQLKKVADMLGIHLVFKASFDKANRSSGSSFRGPGLTAGLAILKKVKKKYGLALLTDIHEPHQAEPVAKVVDIIQIPAFLCRQTDLLIAAAKTGLPVNVKKGQFLAPEDMVPVTSKIESSRHTKILLTERGTFFGYHNLVVDMRSIEIMKQSGYPVIFDATHAVQLPGGLGGSTDGQREFILPLATAAVSLGIAGVFIEVHPSPDTALSDGPNSIALADVPSFLQKLMSIDAVVKHDNNLIC
ncbi:MAG: 3-deoxy-8-phosphooctulonate synthase [Endomicrobiales bacterium]